MAGFQPASNFSNIKKFFSGGGGSFYNHSPSSLNRVSPKKVGGQFDLRPFPLYKVILILHYFFLEYEEGSNWHPLSPSEKDTFTKPKVLLGLKYQC